MREVLSDATAAHGPKLALWPSPGILWPAGKGIFGQLISKSAGNSFLGSIVGYPENSSGNQAEKSLGGGGSCLASPLCSPQSPQRRWEGGLVLGMCITMEKGNGGEKFREIPGSGSPVSSSKRCSGTGRCVTTCSSPWQPMGGPFTS